jgi:PPOX class probable F420-dependent enzyme
MLEAGRVARLAFLDDRDRPRVLPVTYALLDGELWSAIDDKPKSAAEPARVRYLRRRPEAGLVVDVYDDDWSKLAWVQVLGSVEVIDAGEAPDALAALAAKYEAYGAKRPPGPLLRVVPERALCWQA